ncbi:hypothetical protein OHT93_19570 [Streptomyces sp. NBC_00191]|uniref:effector-associated constant component EACC1 n=1 Tax=Streptomyces sp. NBC_00191 TaxID=2975674 RepID=UPI00324633DF
MRRNEQGPGQDEREGAGTTKVVDILVAVTCDPELDGETLERLARGLRAEIAELEVESVRPAPPGAVPADAKAMDAVTLGAVIVALSASGGVFTALIDTLRDWLGRQSARHRISLTIDGDTIELEHSTTAERQELIEAYIRRHSGA